ncbi:MAG: transketolase C-terminal domain-containing protein [Clostridia bacterium]|nr:transketolase C-terminal domain-containing protein [Clostridia bacterium]
MRAYYCDALIRSAEQDDRIIAVEVDVRNSMGTKRFFEQFPDRSVNCGIMEAHAVGFSAGLSAVGFVPFVHAFGTFITRRAYDQLFLSAGYQKLNIKVVGGDAGVTATTNGGTHMPFEDIALVNAIPNYTIVEPADGTMFSTLVPYVARTYGNFYIRTCRKKVMKIYDENSLFEIGKGNVLRLGNDVALIASGIMVYEALVAAEKLRQENIEATVIDMHTIKPIDAPLIVKTAKRCRAIVTCENHNIIGGLGAAVDNIVTANCLVPVEKVGVHDRFGEVGTQEYLMKTLKLTADDIVISAKTAIRRKTR